MECITKIPYTDLGSQHAALKDELLAVTAKIFESCKFILGPEVEEFEHRFAPLCGTQFAVGVNSGTDALILALKALEIGPGDEVITPPNGFVSSVSAVIQVGAKPVFVDVGEDYNIDPRLIECAVTTRAKAILPVHLTGNPAKMDQILEIARKHGLAVVEDAAQAVSAELNGKKVGSFGDIGCFSLHPLKTLNACGDGGVLTTNAPLLYEKLNILRNNGFRNRDECQTFSINSRLDSLQAALLLVKMKYLEEWTEARRQNASIYREKLQHVPAVRLPLDGPGIRHVYHTFVIMAEGRDALKSYLESNGVQTKIHYPIPIHLQPAAKHLGYRRGDFPLTERQAEMILSLPVYPELNEEQINYITQCIKNFYQRKRLQ